MGGAAEIYHMIFIDFVSERIIMTSENAHAGPTYFYALVKEVVNRTRVSPGLERLA